MAKLYFHRKIDVQEFDIDPDKDIFQQILNVNSEQSFDKERFFLYTFPISILKEYNLNDPKLVNEFVHKYLITQPPYKRIGGYNATQKRLEEFGIRYAGIRLSDPEEKIIGQFVRIGKNMTYCPTFPFFNHDFDIVKFANNTYFTTLSFEEILSNQIQHASRYIINKGEPNCKEDIRKYGEYITEEISKEQMIDYATNPESGKNVLIKRLNNKNNLIL